jgi:hypothetical protein
MALPNYLIAVGDPADDFPNREMTQWASWSLTGSLRDPDTFALTGVPGNHPEAAALEETITDLWVYRNGVKIFRGRIIGGTDTLNGDGGAEVNVAAVDYQGLLSRRILLRDRTYVQTPQADIVWDLVREAQERPLAPNPANTLYITRGVAPAGRERDRTYEAGASIGELIDNLSEVLDGFEWNVNPDRQINVGYPRLGSRKHFALDFGGFLNSLTRGIDSGTQANGVWQSGGEGTTPVYVEAPGVAQGGLWQASSSDPDVTEQATVQAKGEGVLAERRFLRPTFKATVSPERWDPTLIGLGDTADLVVSFGRLHYPDLPVRIVEINVSMTNDGAENVSLTLVQDDPA